MSRRDRQRLSIFFVLIAVLALTLVLVYRMNSPETTSAVQSPETKPPAKALTANDARIRLDIVENPDGAQDIGQKNLFQYGQRRVPATGASRGARGTTTEVNPPVPAVTQPVPVVPQAPPGPPPLPPIPLKYTGFAVVSSSLTAFLTDDAGVRHYNVSAGEVLMGRYRISQISDKTVEVEDLQIPRRQTLVLQK
jgi:hypothetical protein